MILNVEHRTSYRYAGTLLRSIQLVHLTPRENERQHVISWSLELPNKGIVSKDCFGNITHYFTLQGRFSELEVVARGIVEVFPFRANMELGTLPSSYYLRITPLTELGTKLRSFVDEFVQQYPKFKFDVSNSLAMLNALSAKILQLVPYTSGATCATTTAQEAFELGAGVCQDHSHIFLGCCRYLGFPARYVSGYLHTDDSSHLASHAWSEIWLGSWYSFDVSNQCSAGEQYIELAYGLDFLDSSPIRGSRIGGGDEILTVKSLVTEQ
ncbi:MAG: transglutaminase family protein [Neisseriaceae bacterium]|nr:MAG: transglutaminase family protein [Neisseriaceae bacterium]